MTAKLSTREKLATTREIRITVTGRKSERKISLPVWFVHEDEKILLLPVTGVKTNWFRNVRKSPEMEVSIKGSISKVTGRAITDLKRVNEVAEQFRAKYGAGDVRRYYPRIDACVEVSLD